ncbi:hypothetical protein L1987_77290 [Smallanthus sonchifolius]|uniref:Uncharacterized protein n=1 Tax=Smallanthus sonchifolius TaxID=185202 RepID=A0ACB8Z9B4_9ASTR|nr:hypothetical protein L1987_77290 [Smallanthus sonchifolius]
MSKEICEDPVASSRSKVLEALKSKYTCIHEPLPAASPDDNRRYLTSLRVFGNREVEEPQSPLSTSSSNLTVDQNSIDPQIIKEKVTAALKVVRFREPRVLVQFWSPVAIRKRCLLTTLDQPFGLGVVDEGLYLYRLESEQRVFVVDGEHREELGPPGRVYRQKLPEWSLDMHGLSTRQSVQDWAASHNIHGYVNLPVFEPSSGCCVGVLELITSSNYVDYAFEVRQVSSALKEENLKSPNVLEDTRFYTHIGDEKRQLELDEIFCALKMVCDIQNLPLAQTWGPCGYSSVVANSGNLERSCSSFRRNCIGKVCMSTAALPFYVRDLSMWGFHEACRERHLDKSQGVVGRSLSSCGLCFCGDVSKLGEDEYPLVPYARMHGITSCLAIYLKSLEVDGEYVIELFLPTQSENEADLHSLLKTVKEHIKNASRIQLGNISPPQVIGGIPLKWNLESPTFNEKGEVAPELEILHPLAENERNGYDVEHMEEDKPSNSAAPGTNQNAVVSYSDAGIEDVDVNTGKRREKHIDNSKEPIGKKKRTDSSISLEEDKPSNSAAPGTNQNAVVPYSDAGIEDVDVNTGKTREKYNDNSKEPIRKKKRTDSSISLEEDKPSNSAAPGTNQNAIVPYSDAGIEDVDVNTLKTREKYNDNSKEPIRKKKRTDRSISLEEDKPLNSAAAAGSNQNVLVPCLDIGIEDVDTKPIRKRKRTDRSISLEEISKHYGKTMEEAADTLRVSRSTLKRICRSHGIPRWPYSRTPNDSDPLLKPDQTDADIHASAIALTTLVLGTFNATNRTHDPATLTEHSNHTSTLVVHPKATKKLPVGQAKPETTIRDSHIDNIAANTFTIKVTYRKNTVKFSFRLLDGLAKLEKLVATRFQLGLGSFSLKYEDEDGDMILIACDNDLTASLVAFTRPDVQPVIRLSVWPIAHQDPDA